jgi:eukaryotic-like serine/threonine-protein kinase
MEPSDPVSTPTWERSIGSITTEAAPAVVGDYRIVRVLGEGNHGRFYLALPPARLRLAEEFVALKVFGERVTDRAYERSVRELRMFAAVESPYVARIFDALLEDHFAYAMEYFPMGSLAAPARPVARSAVLKALEQGARAVHDLHEAGVIHGDVKPANILLVEGGGGRLSDLGLARFINPGATLTGLGRASSVEYLDPDLLGGARPSRRTEVWALGATIHRALSGSGLYGELSDSQPLLAIRKVLSTPAEVHPSLGRRDADLVRACIAPGVDRLQTAQQVADGVAALPHLADVE